MRNESSEATATEATNRRRRVWATAGLTLGVVATLGFVGAAWWAWLFLHERLSPWLTTVLTRELGRPVKVGEVERVALTGVRFGKSAIPPTGTDPSELFVDSIRVGFNPLSLLQRELNPEFVLDNVQVYLEEDAQGEWLEIELPDARDDGKEKARDRGSFIRINPSIQVEQGEVILQPYAPPTEAQPNAFIIDQIQGQVTLTHLRDMPDFRDEAARLDAREIRLDVSAEPGDMGQLQTQGTLVIPQLDSEAEGDSPSFLDRVDAKLTVQAQQVDLAPILPLVPLSPDTVIDTVAGVLSGNVDIDLTPQQTPRMTGTAQLTDGAIAFRAVETAFKNIDAAVQFQGDRAAFDRLSVNYGALVAVARGTIDPRRGYDLTGTIAPITLNDLARVFNFTPPVPAEGVLRADTVRVTGPLSKPQVTGKVLSTTPLTIDKVNLASLSTDLTYVINQLEFANLSVLPQAGGQLLGEGKFVFGKPAELAINLRGQDLPADTIAQAYGLPDTVQLGAIALDAKVSGPVNNLTGLVKWEAPGGTYPTRGTAEITANVIRVSDAVVQIAGGTVTGGGILAQGQWTADLATQGIQLGQFNGALQGIAAAGTAQLAGSLDNLTLQGIRGTGDITATSPDGTLNGFLTLNQGSWTADLDSPSLALARFNPALPDVVASGTAQLTGNLDDLTVRGIRGTGNLTATTPEGSVNGLLNLNQGNWTADLTSPGLALDRFNESLVGVVAAGNAQLSGNLDNLTLAGIAGTGDVTAALRGGTLNTQLALANGNWNATVQTQAFPVRQFARGLPVDTVSGTAQLAGNLADLSPTGIRGDGTINAEIAGGSLVSDFSLQNGVWQARGQASELQLSQFGTGLQGTGAAGFQLAGNLNNLSPAGVQGQVNLRLSDGVATAAGLNPELGRLRSPLTARLNWDGRQLDIIGLETAGLYASGVITPEFPATGAPRIAAVDLALSARDYNLATLPVDFPPALALQGQATFDGNLTGSQENLSLVGSLALNDLALNDLTFESLLTGDVTFSTQQGLNVALTGQEQDEIFVSYRFQPRDLDFRVRAGTAIAQGETENDLLQARLFEFPLSVLNIQPVVSAPYGPLRGTVTFASAAINLDTLNTNGQVNIANLGFGYYSIDRLFGGFAYRDGNFTFDDGRIRMADRDNRGNVVAQRDYDISGRFSRSQTPQLYATLSTQEGELRDIFEVLKIQEIADFRRGFVPQEGFIPRSVEEAQAVLRTEPVGDPHATLLAQLRRLSEIRELQVQQGRQQQQATLPPLEELQGRFQGNVEFSATLPTDLTVVFDLEGDRWRWGSEFSADTVIARGTYQNGLVNLASVSLSSQLGEDLALVSLEGDFSLDPEDQGDRVMNLTATNVPVEELKDIANLPFNLGGRLNGEAQLRGRLAAPDLTGNLEIVDGTLNERPLEEATATFAYQNSRASLDARLRLPATDDPITVAASIPYKPDFVETAARDQTYFLKANVKDEGFALLNLFTPQMEWVSGSGEAILDIRGDFQRDRPDLFNGLVILEDATLALRALPEPMTNVSGRVRLVPEGLLVAVDSLTGQFSEGELSAQGLFPLLLPLNMLGEAAMAPSPVQPTAPEAPEADPTAAATTEADTTSSEPEEQEEIAPMPLTLDLQNIALNLKGQYSGQVNGQLVVGGAALVGPRISGEIDLSDGILTIPENNQPAGTLPALDANPSQAAIPVRFANLAIDLAQNIQIVYGGFLNVTGQGKIFLDGPLTDLRPQGLIRLPSGRVGLYAASLRLAGTNDRAEFRGTFDPLLDITLQTALPDTNAGSTIQPTTSPFPRNEVPDGTIQNLGLTQQGNSLVRINARYFGSASELQNLTTDARNLELTSSPVRSQQEIITLLSGNIIGALGNLDDGDALAGIGTFLGSALLSSVRDFLGDTIPLSEFRIFQVTETSGGVNDSEDIGGEIGFDVTSNISVSVLKVLTNDTPFQFNTRYRISDQFTLRGTTSFEEFRDRTGVLLEYESRF
jgi:translocation and assembly module TamB